MRNPGGYFITSDPGPRKGQPKTIERDTFACQHCGKQVFVEPMCDPADMGGICNCCAQLICPACVRDGRCIPLEERLRQEEASYEARRSYGI